MGLTNSLTDTEQQKKDKKRMSTTSKKHVNFVSEPMGDKPVNDIAGIGPTYQKRLQEKGFEYAYNLLGQFLLVNKDEEMFQEWLKEEVSMTPNIRRIAPNALPSGRDPTSKLHYI